MSRKYFDPGKTEHTKALSEYAVNLKYDNIPPDVIERVKLMTLHTLGSSLAAASVDLTKKAIESGRLMSNAGKSTTWVGGAKMSAIAAAFVNGTLADMLDWEDCSWAGHPSAGTFPAAIAVAEELGSRGKTYLESVVAGLEVYIRAAMAVQPPRNFNHNQGWGLTSWQIIAATVPAAKLMNMDVNMTNQAYGMAAIYTTISSNLSQGTMSNAYHYEHGINAMAGVLAAYNAKLGLDNLQGAFDVPYAWVEKLTTEPKREWFIKDLDEFLLMKILIKHWPANMWVQTPVEIVGELAEKHRINPDNISEILVNPPTQFRMHFYNEGFSSLMEAQFSMPYCIAAILLDPKPGANWYTREMMNNKKLLELASKVKSGSDPEHTLQESFNMYVDGDFPEKTVTITMKDGTKYTGTKAGHKGHPEDMLTRNEFFDLFRHNASAVMTENKANKIIDYIMNLEDVKNMSNFGELLI
ncbi:MAG: MmgE/PrpD family protein [Eubacterium sp.]|jgi:2-methylcitrate dehydratase PrpD|nr:MmgE/PrpD family protein [Eubacterium sp.]